MREGRLRLQQQQRKIRYYCHRIYGLIPDCTVGNAWKILMDGKWVETRMEMDVARNWYLVGTPYRGDLEYIRARI